MDWNALLDAVESIPDAFVTAGIATLTALFVMTIGTIVVPARRQRGEHQRAARYLAIRVVCILDKYVDDCMAVANDWGEPNWDDQGIYEDSVRSPAPPVYPQDVNWQSIDYNLMYDILALPTWAESAQRSISAHGEHSDPPDHTEYYEERIVQYARLGLRALAITERLRKSYAVSALTRTQWSPVGDFYGCVANVETKREARRKRAEKWATGKSDATGSEDDGEI